MYISMIMNNNRTFVRLNTQNYNNAQCAYTAVPTAFLSIFDINEIENYKNWS